jgi:hypothetical protein
MNQMLSAALAASSRGALCQGQQCWLDYYRLKMTGLLGIVPQTKESRPAGRSRLAGGSCVRARHRHHKTTPCAASSQVGVARGRHDHPAAHLLLIVLQGLAYFPKPTAYRHLLSLLSLFRQRCRPGLSAQAGRSYSCSSECYSRLATIG